MTLGLSFHVCKMDLLKGLATEPGMSQALGSGLGRVGEETLLLPMPVSSQPRSCPAAHHPLPAAHLYVRRTCSRPPASRLPLTIRRSLMPVWDTARTCTPVPTLPWGRDKGHVRVF